jgi:hypothetical protein
MVGGKQYVAVASGGDIVAFALMDPSPPKAGKPPRRKP